MINRNSKFTFGKYKRKPLKQCDDGYLEWMVKNLSDDFSEWIQAAKDELEMRKKEDTETGDLEDQADAFLRKHNVDPNKL